MPQTYHYTVHTNGPALWPQHKSLSEVIELRDTTLPDVWEATYQGHPTPPGGSIFKRGWWQQPDRRYDATNQGHINACVARWISFDTALKEEETNAYTSMIVGELWPDYRMAIRLAWRDRIGFDELPGKIVNFARIFNHDLKLRSVLIEDKVSGISAYQTLSKSTEEPWIAGLLVPFMPIGDKVVRAKQASVWCANGCILLPAPSSAVPWLIDFEDELFTFPGSSFADQVDAFSQLVIYTENILADGWRFRGGKELAA